jgi:hypothetical protein
VDLSLLFFPLFEVLQEELVLHSEAPDVLFLQIRNFLQQFVLHCLLFLEQLQALDVLELKSGQFIPGSGNV